MALVYISYHPYKNDKDQSVHDSVLTAWLAGLLVYLDEEAILSDNMQKMMEILRQHGIPQSKYFSKPLLIPMQILFRNDL